MVKKIALIFTVILSLRSYSSTIFIPDGDTAALFQLISLTASQLNELERLVSNAEKYTEKIEKYNNLINDKYYQLMLIQDIVNNYMTLQHVKIDDLGDINYILRNAIYDAKRLKELAAKYKVKQMNSSKQERKTVEQDRKLKKELNEAKKHASRSASKNSSVAANQITAQNTALTQLKVSQSNVLLNGIQNQNASRNELLFREASERKLKKDNRLKWWGAK